MSQYTKILCINEVSDDNKWLSYGFRTPEVEQKFYLANCLVDRSYIHSFNLSTYVANIC